MQPSRPLIAIGIGAFIALSPSGAALSQPSDLSDASSNSQEPTPSRFDKSESAPQPADFVDFALKRYAPQWTLVRHSVVEISSAVALAPEKQPTVKQVEPETSDSAQSEITPAEVAEPSVTSPERIERPSSEISQETSPSEAPADVVEESAPADAVVDPESMDAGDGASSDDASPDAESEQVDAIEAGIAAPEYLEPDGNPLLFPTQPDEVRVVGTQPITLEQALELARRNNRELQVTEQELERARAALREARAALYPNLDFNAGLTVSENQDGSNSTQDALNQFFGIEPVEQDDADIGAQGQLQLNYDLYTSGRRSALIRAAEEQVRIQELQYEVALEQLRLDISNDYYQLQEGDEQVRIARTTLAEAQQSLRDAQALERAGVGTRFDVLQAEVDVANAQQQINQAISNQLTARRQLAQRLSLAENVDVSAADPVEVAERWELSLEDSILLAYRNRAELDQQLAQRELSEQQRRAALANLGPQISLFADYTLSDTLNVDQDVVDQYRFGAQMQWRLFDGGAARARAQQEEANIAIAETQFADTRNRVRFQVEEAYFALQANFNNIQTAALALQQATESLRLARLRFQAGVGTQSDVLRAQTELTTAELNQVRAILGYNRALVSMERAVSNLDGILADRP